MWAVHLILSVVITFVVNIVFTALDLPWQLRPYAVVRWITVDLGTAVARRIGSVCGYLYAEFIMHLWNLLERLAPAVKTTGQELLDILLSGFMMARAFAASWSETLMTYTQRGIMSLVNWGDPWAVTLVTAAVIVACLAVYNNYQARKDENDDANAPPSRIRKSRSQ